MLKGPLRVCPRSLEAQHGSFFWIATNGVQVYNLIVSSLSSLFLAKANSMRFSRISLLPAFLTASLAMTLLPTLAGEPELTRDSFSAEQRSYWALQRVAQPGLPVVHNAAWVRNPIDAFVRAQLEARGLAPSPRADNVTLIRRVSLDLIGLPPTPREVEAFMADRSPIAYEKVVDRLLASPQYGERWARHWLDLARYAESEGFKSDETRPNAWRYRDYVIRALNADKPYDRYVQEQIAGDELWPEDPDARVATAFNRHYPDESNARNLLQRRQEILNDITDTVGSVFLGLTYGCARCHNHKFDPILQADYYRLQAFFANIRAADDFVLIPPGAVRHRQEKMAVWNQKTQSIRDEMKALLEPRRKQMVDALFAKYPPEIQSAIVKPAAERTPIEWQMYYKAKPYMNPSDEEVMDNLKDKETSRWSALKQELAKYSDLYPGDLPIGTGIVDVSQQAPETHVLAVGVYDSPGEQVQPGFLSILDPAPAKISAPSGAESTGRRTALAHWLTDPQNPLPARVMVNRLWHYHFGRGIVASPSDFGNMGDRPTHAALLDWLAREFVRQGWSLKAMHRLIVTSNTYQEASLFNETAAKADPQNVWLWRFPRQRLEAEVIRDSALWVSGRLNPKMNGPSVFPELPPGMESRGGWKVTDSAAERDRRSVYVFVRRNTRYPLFEAFDMPDTHESCARRNITTTAPQALSLLNSRLTLEWAQAFAGRVLAAAGASAENQIDMAFRFAYSRRPDDSEKEIAKTFFKRQRNLLSEKPREQLALPANVADCGDPLNAAALVDFCHVLINSNEFVYRN
jgi:uncharacterized protein DUF1553/uncharacterized protein DUF1549